MGKINLKIGKTYVIRYQDASYSYVDIVKKNLLPPKNVVSIGKIRRIEKDFIDLGTTWLKSEEKYFDGIIIPRDSILKIYDI